MLVSTLQNQVSRIKTVSRFVKQKYLSRELVAAMQGLTVAVPPGSLPPQRKESVMWQLAAAPGTAAHHLVSSVASAQNSTLILASLVLILLILAISMFHLVLRLEQLQVKVETQTR